MTGVASAGPRPLSELGFDGLASVFRGARFTTAVEHAIRVMVFNRLCDPVSKLGVLRWLQTVSMPSIDVDKLSHQHLLRSMDALMDHQQAIDDCVAQLLRPLIDEDLSVVFYDLTTIRAEGMSQQDGLVRHFGMSKEGVIARQFMLAIVQTADGMPIFHEVFDGNAAEAPTLQPTLKKVLARYPHIRRLVVVADRGLLSLPRRSARPCSDPTCCSSPSRPASSSSVWRCIVRARGTSRRAPPPSTGCAGCCRSSASSCR